MNPVRKLDERELLVKLRDGDVMAFEKLYNFYKEHIITHLLYLFKDDNVIQDVAQETFVTVWEKREELNPDKSFRSFLYTIATNKVYDLMRKAQHDKDLYSALIYFMDESSNVVEEYLQQKEYEEQIYMLLSQMPEQQRKIYKLAKIEGYSYDEIAAMTGISRHTVNTYIKRANLFLKQQVLNRSELFALAIGIILNNTSSNC